MWKKVCTNKGLAKFAESIEARQISLSAVTHDPSRYVIMFRPGMLRGGDWHEEMPCNPTLIYSSWRGYLEREPWKVSWEIVHRMLEKTGGEVIQRHTSGHIAKTDWIALVKALSPKAIIPIHTDAPEAYATLVDNVLQLPDNIAVSLT
jgi:ribonuclease J